VSTLETRRARASQRARTFAWEDPLDAAHTAAGHSGLEFMRAIIDGTLPAPPIAQMLGMSLVAVGEGRAVFGLEPDEWMYNPIGSVHGGVAATILDSCMGCAIHTTLPAGVGYTTTDLHVRYTRAMHAGQGLVLAEGNVVHSGSRTATAEGRLYLAGDEDLLFAHASAGCVILAPSSSWRS
jgi:uncharacterized protein (TIGR00369 family)